MLVKFVTLEETIKNLFIKLYCAGKVALKLDKGLALEKTSLSSLSATASLFFLEYLFQTKHTE